MGFTTQESATLTVRVMWPDGPSRNVSPVPCPGARMPSDLGVYMGNYVCQGCGAPAVGVYRVISTDFGRSVWICAECRTARKPKKAKRGFIGEEMPTP
jgi:hypothetical protein